MKGKNKLHSEEIAQEVQRLTELKAKAEADLASSQTARANLREQKRKLQVAAYQNDRNAVQRRDDANKQLIALELGENDLQDTIAELNGAIAKLTQEAGYAKRQEAGQRILARQRVVVERMDKIWHGYQIVEGEIKELWKLTRDEWSDCAVVGIRNVSSRKFTPAWHLVDVMQRLLKMAERDEPLPHGDFLQALPELVRLSQEAARFELERALKREPNLERQVA